MSEDFGFETESSKRNAKTGRRAQSKQAKAPAAPDFEASPGGDSPQPAQDIDDGPPKPNRVSGWGEDAPRRRGRNLGEGMEQFEETVSVFSVESERLRPHSPDKSDDSDNDIPVIPDLEDQQEEDITQTVAYAPNVAVNRVATYKELDNDLLRQAAFLTLDNEIDLKLLTKSLATDSDLIEEDKPWDWDRLFTEVTSELLTQWEKAEQPDASEKDNVPNEA
ncbi:intraflagellar transport protein 43 homolog isoform X2 [Ruditapes philippinarum]|uniref:intraflagellar transport protein 43 homolog isoform X2 n=1 Tax=Ruditapes philippinarum TaxID=129788 RepID=UPI00295A8D7D|nr:intraflagellar transport protein 43 homolog isoform X2 [Ruditapes philippinarum]